MKKFLIVFVSISLLFLTGCMDEKKIVVNMNCDGEESSFNLKKSDTFKCELAGEEYTFKVQKIQNQQIIINASNIGLTYMRADGSISLQENRKRFTIPYGETTTIATQTMDHSDKMILSWDFIK